MLLYLTSICLNIICQSLSLPRLLHFLCTHSYPWGTFITSQDTKSAGSKGQLMMTWHKLLQSSNFQRISGSVNPDDSAISTRDIKRHKYVFKLSGKKKHTVLRVLQVFEQTNFICLFLLIYICFYFMFYVTVYKGDQG